MTKSKTKTLKSSGKLPSSPPGRDELLTWGDLRAGDAFVIANDDASVGPYSGTTYTVVRAVVKPDDVTVTVLLGGGALEVWSGDVDEPYYPDALIGRGR